MTNETPITPIPTKPLNQLTNQECMVLFESYGTKALHTVSSMNITGQDLMFVTCITELDHLQLDLPPLRMNMLCSDLLNYKQHGVPLDRCVRHYHIVIHGDSSVYEGDIVNGLMHGRGKLTYPNRNRFGYKYYEGDFRNNVPDGQGKMIWQDGRVYEGEWKQNRKHGQGRLTLPDGTVIEGVFEDDLDPDTAKCLRAVLVVGIRTMLIFLIILIILKATDKKKH